MMVEQRKGTDRPAGATGLREKTVVLDFDGVVHSYASGWKGYDVIPDPPTNGAKEAIEEMRKNYQVVIVSSRCGYPMGLEAIWRWLDRYGIAVDGVSAFKPACVVVVDDRGLRFDGKWDEVLAGLAAASIPWWSKRDTQEVK